MCVAPAIWRPYNRIPEKRGIRQQPWDIAIEFLLFTAHHSAMCMLPRHRGVIVRRLGLVLLVLAALAAARSTNSIAMEEQRGAIPGGTAVPDATPKAQDQEESATAPAKSETGTEIRIPGLGKIGTLPKMDFGLDLLYGAVENDNAKTTPDFPSSDEDEKRDMMIHGSVKHHF
jgi:hypothetical protein